MRVCTVTQYTVTASGTFDTRIVLMKWLYCEYKEVDFCDRTNMSMHDKTYGDCH